MQSIRFIRLFFVLAAVFCSGPAHAAYVFTTIDYPGASETQLFGVNDAGKAVGSGQDAGGNFLAAFTFNSKTAVFTPVAPAPGSVATDVVGINDFGVMVGGITFDGVTENGFVRSKDGTYTVFSKPGFAFTQARGINNRGLVTGWADDGAGNTVGFIYDPAHNTYIDILPSPFALAHGINTRGDVAGHVEFDAGVACTGCSAGRYGWLRASSGAITLFRVNGYRTAARGITDSGLITGWVIDPVSGHVKGFVGTLVGLPGYESLTIPDTELLEVPGAVLTIANGITDAGVMVGIFDDVTGEHGFIAAPSPEGTSRS